MSTRILNGILDNFLGTYTSRYSDYEGYWLFGVLVGDLGKLEIDLIFSGPTGTGPKIVARQVAAIKFREQVEKASFPISRVREAWLDIEKLPESKEGFAGDYRRLGHDLRFSARVKLASGKEYKRGKVVFVAPHDSEFERRSTRF